MFFDFQVNRRAQELVPRSATHADENRGLVQFIVDTAGVPESGSLRVVKRPPSGEVDTLAAWRRIRARRYAAAVYRGCRVRMVVQEPAPGRGARGA